MIKGLSLAYLGIGGTLVYYKLRYLTILTCSGFVLITTLQLSAWYNTRNTTKRKKIIVYCRLMLSLMVDVELLLISLKADRIADLGMLALFSMVWAIIPFAAVSCVASFIGLMARLSMACKRSKDNGLMINIPFFFWLFLVFCGGPAFFYGTVYNLCAIPSKSYQVTSALSTFYIIMTVYSMVTLVFHLLIISHFK